MDLASRAPLNANDLNRQVVDGWRLVVVAETGSTNADLLARASAGEPAGQVLVAELQTGGRGRLNREWHSPAGAGLTCSLLLRPSPAVPTWGWLPLLTGLALCQAVGGDAALKWPNDLLLGPDRGKAAGILLQVSGAAAVVGIGVNVSTTADELPVATATSLALAGRPQLDRGQLLLDLLVRFDALYAAWQQADGDAERSGLAPAYRAASATVGQRVSVQLPDREIIGDAMAIDAAGQLVVHPEGAAESVAVAAGDVTHVRAVSR
jgi:BirA family biotin operon repressor/biotin-[acetyl-CoA-carboxylase] ligase